LDHEKDDAQSFADWGVDYLKYDNCYHMGRFGTPLISFQRFNAMAEALKATGKNIFYSLCNWGEDYSYSVSLSCRFETSVFIDTDASKQHSGLRPLVTHGVFSETSTTLLPDQMIYALAMILLTRLVLLLARTAQFSPSSTESFLISIAAFRADGMISICLKLAMAV
jgi:hypothetical protein